MVDASLKLTNPEKYERDRKRCTDYMREWRKKYPEKARKWAKKYFHKIKKDPVKYARLKKQMADYQKIKWKTDPVFREKMLEWNRQYRKRLKENNPKKYRRIFCKHSNHMQPFIRGLICGKCGKNIITNTAGKSQRHIQCPECGKYWHKDELKKVKMKRNIPEIGVAT